VIKQHVFNYINNYKIILQEIYNWLLNNQNNSNSIYLLGYFNYHGIETYTNRQKAFELFQKAALLENNIAQLKLAEIYIDEGYNNTAFELSIKLAEKGIPKAMSILGYCYEEGIGTDFNEQKAFELYQKAADLKNSAGMNNLGLCYKN